MKRIDYACTGGGSMALEHVLGSTSIGILTLECIGPTECFLDFLFRLRKFHRFDWTWEFELKRFHLWNWIFMTQFYKMNRRKNERRKNEGNPMD